MSDPYRAGMQWLTDLVALLSSHGACSNASRSLAEEREAAAQMERFLITFSHPAGQARNPVEPVAGECNQVA